MVSPITKRTPLPCTWSSSFSILNTSGNISPSSISINSAFPGRHFPGLLKVCPVYLKDSELPALLSAHFPCLGSPHYSMRERCFLSGEWGQEPGTIQGWPCACGSVLRLECRRLKQRCASQQRELSLKPVGLKPEAWPQGRSQESLQSPSQNRRGGHQGGRLGRRPL